MVETEPEYEELLCAAPCAPVPCAFSFSVLRLAFGAVSYADRLKEPPSVDPRRPNKLRVISEPRRPACGFFSCVDASMTLAMADKSSGRSYSSGQRS